MNYHRLSQDQLNSVYKQFIFYLSSKGIDKKLWDRIMNECSFFNYSDKDQLFLFNSKKKSISVIVVKCLNKKINIQNNKDWNWILKNIKDKDISIYQSSRKYPEQRNTYIYKYLKKGAIISDGKKFKSLETCFSI